MRRAEADDYFSAPNQVSVPARVRVLQLLRLAYVRPPLVRLRPETVALANYVRSYRSNEKSDGGDISIGHLDLPCFFPSALSARPARQFKFWDEAKAKGMAQAIGVGKKGKEMAKWPSHSLLYHGSNK